MTFYVFHAGQKLGPYNLDDVNAQLRNGSLIASDLGWNEDLTEWLPLSQIPGVVTPVFKRPPPPPSARSTPPPLAIPPPPPRHPPPPPQRSAEWYYVLRGEKLGPVSQDLIPDLPQDTPVWKPGMLDWLPLYQTDLRKSNAPPPISGENVNNVVVWLWAFAPLIPIPLRYWLISCAINCLFWWWDGRVVAKSGHNREGWGFWGFFLVPVYLFVRAARLKQNCGYAVVWLVVFVLSILGLRF
jgi:hypothetical protein